ncbi:MAG: histidine kinase, partial [Comamonadaceae bacterium]
MNPPAFQTARAAPSEDDLDAGEFASFASRQDPLDIEAATWAVRRRDGLDASDRAELQA